MTRHDGYHAGPAAPDMDRAAAQAFCVELAETIDALIEVLEEETKLVRAARLSEAAGLAEQKATLSQRYSKAHGVIQASGQEIGRRAPVEIDHLRRRHRDLETSLSTNLAVLATARTVSETLIRGVAAAVSPNAARPATYNAEARSNDPGGPPAGPLTLNVAL